MGHDAALPRTISPGLLFRSIVYGSSKAAVSMLTVQFARALSGIKFNAVEPGITATELEVTTQEATPAADPSRVHASLRGRQQRA